MGSTTAHAERYRAPRKAGQRIGVVTASGNIDTTLPLFESGRLRPVVDSRYGLDDIAEAHRRMEANANAGKIVIRV